VAARGTALAEVGAVAGADLTADPSFVQLAKGLKNGVSVSDENIVEEFWSLHGRVVGEP
jgi:hypothetical protein